MIGPAIEGDFKKRRDAKQKAEAKRTARQGEDGVFRSGAAYWQNGILYRGVRHAPSGKERGGEAEASA